MPSAVAFASDGMMYGAVAYGGASGKGYVFQLAPPASPGGEWTETTLHDFNGGKFGRNPYDLVIGERVIYGIASGGNGYGLVFRLSPMQSGGWRESILHEFQQGTDSEGPRGLFLTHAKLYGTTFRTVYRLKRPQGGKGPWVERVLYRFNSARHGDGPNGGVVMWNAKLYGVTIAGGQYNNGTIFQLTP